MHGAAELDARLLAAHAAHDGRALVHLYAEAAERSADPDAAAFFRTHAWVWALDTGAQEAAQLHAQLSADGRA